MAPAPPVPWRPSPALAVVPRPSPRPSAVGGALHACLPGGLLSFHNPLRPHWVRVSSGLHAKLARVQRLIGEGWHVVDIASDHERIEARFSRGSSRERVTFDRRDARALLFGDEPSASAARFRVRAPLR